jgi:hypothetical protein
MQAFAVVESTASAGCHYCKTKVDVKRELDPVLMIHVWRAIDGVEVLPPRIERGRAKAEPKR